MGLVGLWGLALICFGDFGKVRLGNVGRCDHSYAHWLAQLQDRVPSDRQGSDLILRFCSSWFLGQDVFALRFFLSNQQKAQRASRPRYEPECKP